MNGKYTRYGITVEELEIEHVELSSSDSDPRLEGLSARTKHLINQRFGGDVGLAEHTAKILVHTQREPDHWVREMVAPLSGWNDPLRTKVFR